MNGTPDILRRIIARKAEEVRARAERLPLCALSPQIETAPVVRGFADALRSRVASGKPAVIAEIKKASPSKGVLGEQFDTAEIARSYERHGATCRERHPDRAGCCTAPRRRSSGFPRRRSLYESKGSRTTTCPALLAAESQRVLRNTYLIRAHSPSAITRAAPISPNGFEIPRYCRAECLRNPVAELTLRTSISPIGEFTSDGGLKALSGYR